MLRQVRGGLKTVGAWFVIVLLVLAFALWGVPELRNFTQRAPLSVGKVGYSNSSIIDEFNRQMERRRDESNGQFTREDAIAAGLPDLVISSIATRSVLLQEADKMGLVMPRSLVRDYLRKDERFQNPATGRFDQFVLQGILDDNRMTATRFEGLMKEDLLRTQLVNSVAAGAQAPKSFTNSLLMREVERRKVGYLTVTEEMAGIPAEPTPDVLSAYYEENKSAFTAPEYRTFTAVIIRSSDFTEGLEAPEDEIRKLYDLNKTRIYDSPEKRTIYQITYDSEGEAQAAVASLRQGKPFENLASEKGLTLGAATFTDIQKSDILDPSVADAAFAEDLAEGAIVDPVKSLFGWTVVQLAGVTPPQTKTYEEVRESLVAQYLEQDTRRRVLETIDAIEEARDTGAPLTGAAERAGVAFERFGPVDSFSFAPGGAIIADIPGEILSEAFKLDEGDESEAIQLSDGGYFFVQVDEIEPPAPHPFEDVSEQVAARWRADDRRRRIADAVKQVTDAMAGGASLSEAAEPFNRAPLERVLDRRGGNEAFSDGLVDRIFNADQGAVISGDAGSGDAQTVAEIRQIGFARSQIGPGEETAFQQYLTYQLNQEYLEAYITALRNDYGVKTNQNALSQLFSETQ